MRRFLWVALVLAALPAWAQRAPGVGDVLRARSYGMGGAFRAMGGGTDVVDGNPAAMGVFRRYVIELSGAWDPRNPFGFGAISVMDSATNPLAAGVNYQLVSVGSGADHRVAHINTAAFGLPFGDVLHVGMSARHVLMTGAHAANAITGDAGVLLNLGGLTFSVAGHNLVDIYNPDFPRYYSGAAAFLTPVFSIAADVKADFNGANPAFAFSGGGEYLLFNALPVRAGYTHDLIRNARVVSGGLGFFVENGSVDVAYQHELGGSFSRLLALTLRMQLR